MMQKTRIRKRIIGFFMAFLLMLCLIADIIPGMMITAEAKTNYKVLLWVPYLPTEQYFNTWKNQIVSYYNSMTGINVTVTEKSGALNLSGNDLSGVDLVQIFPANNPSTGSYSILGDNNVNVSLLRNFANSGGRIIMNGEIYGCSDKFNEASSELAGALGGDFTIENNNDSSTKNISFNPAKSSLTQGCEAIYPNCFANITSQNMNTAVWVIKGDDNKVFVMDQKVGRGYITAISDCNWLVPSEAPNPDAARNAARQLLRNLLVDSAQNIESVGAATIIGPQDLEWYEGDGTARTVSITATATNGGTLSYQWYKGTSSDFVPGASNIISGATEHEYSIPSPGTMAVGSYYYKCVVTNTKGSESATATSEAATVTVLPDVQPITDINLVLWPSNFWYDGSDKSPEVIVKVGNTVLTEDVDYTVSGTRSASDINESPGYEITVNGIGHYTGTGRQSWNISRVVPIIITPPTATEIEYGQSLADSVLSGGVGNVPGTFTWAEPTIKPAVSDSMVTEYMVIFTPNDTVSYIGTDSVHIKVKVNKAPSNYITRPTGKQQGSSEREVELANPGSTSDGTLLYALGSDAVTAPATSAFSATIPKAKNPGTYYVWYMIVGDSNHRDSAPEYVTTYLIGNTPRITTPPVASEIDYGQSLASSVLSGGAANVPGEFTWADSAIKPEVSDSNYTEYLVVFTPYDRIGNIGTDTARVRVKVNKVPSNYITRPTGNQLISGDIDVALANLGSTAEGTILYALGTDDTTPPDGGSFSTKVPKAKEAGTYYIWFKIVGDANHMDSAPECITATLVDKVDPEHAVNKPAIDKEIAETNTDRTDVKDTKYYILAAKLKPKGKTLKLTWNKIPEAEGYMIYGSPCGVQMEYITTIKNNKKTSWSPNKVRKDKYYKYLVIAYKMEGDTINRISTSKSVHAITGSNRRGNPTKVQVKKRKYRLAKNGIVKISASFKYDRKVNIHIAKFRYETDRPDIVRVDRKGYIQGLKPGKAWVYVYAQNGVSKSIRVTVK